MKLKHLCLLLLAVVACTAAQSEDDIPVENDNQFPPDNNSEAEGNVFNESEDTVIDITTPLSDQPEDESTLSTIETITPTTEAPNTSESSIPPVEDTQSTTQADVEAAEDQITSDTTEEGVDAVDGFAVTEISTSEEPVNEDVTTETSTPLVEEVPLPELEASEDATLVEPVETFSTEPNVTQGEEVQMSTTEPDVAISELNTDGESIYAVTTNFSAAVDQDQGEPIDDATTEPSSQDEDVLFSTSANEIDVGISNDSAIDQDPGEPINAATTESSSPGEDLSFSTSANETDLDASNDSAIRVAKFSVLLDGDEQLPTTKVDLKDNSEVGTSTEFVHDVTTEPSVPLTMDEQLLTDDSVVKEESTDIVSSIEPIVVSTTEAGIPLSVDEELPTTELEDKDKPIVDVPDTTLDGSDIAKNNLQTTQTNEESLNDGATITPVSPIDPSEFSIRSNIDRNDLEAISPLTLAEPPKEDVAPEEVDLSNETKADNKVEDVSVGATTSVNKAGGIDKSVIAVIVAGMVVVVAGITIKKNWKSIKNKFSSSPRPANDRTNHTNGIAPEEVPLQDKDNQNPSPV